MSSGEGRGGSPGRHGAEGGVTKAPLSKAISTSGVETRKPAVTETRPHSAENRDSLKRDKLAEEVERIAVRLHDDMCKMYIYIVGTSCTYMYIHKMTA